MRMVFFTCSSCGESLKKTQVEKHTLKCRACQCLSCIDCGRDFWGDEYRNHTRCISEDQKYGGRDFQVKVNKGDVKQQQWIERIHEAMNKPGIDLKLRQVLGQVSSYDNVPRKRSKFQNWMKNSLKIHNPSLIEQVWEIFSSATSSQEVPQNNHQTEDVPHHPTEITNILKNETETDEGKNKSNREKKEKKTKRSSDEISEEQSVENRKNTSEKRLKNKRKREEENEQITEEKKKRKREELDESLNSIGVEPVNQEAESESSSKGKFNWKGTIKAVLRDAPEEGLAVKKLRKKVLAAYYSFSGEENYKSEEQLLSLFNRKINNNPKFKILKDKVRLVN